MDNYNIVSRDGGVVVLETANREEYTIEDLYRKRKNLIIDIETQKYENRKIIERYNALTSELEIIENIIIELGGNLDEVEVIV